MYVLSKPTLQEKWGIAIIQLTDFLFVVSINGNFTYFYNLSHLALSVRAVGEFQNWLAVHVKTNKLFSIL